MTVWVTTPCSKSCDFYYPYLFCEHVHGAKVRAQFAGVGPVLPPFGVPWIELRLSGLSLRCLPGPTLPRLVDGILVFWLISM